MNKNLIEAAFRNYVASTSSPFRLPAGDQSKIPLDTEIALLDAIAQSGLQSYSFGKEERLFDVGVKEAYRSLGFAVRMAIYAVRINNPLVLSQGIYGVVLSNGEVDWRDLLRGLSIIQDCCGRLGTDLEQILPKSAFRCGMEGTIRGYLGRDQEGRSVDAMSFDVIETPQGIAYKDRYSLN